MKRGDVITAVNGEAVRDSNVLRNRVAELQPGSQIELNVLRDGKPRTLSLTLGELTDVLGNAEDDGPGQQPDGTGFGMTVEPLTRDSALS